jgi:plastocyanin
MMVDSRPVRKKVSSLSGLAAAYITGMRCALPLLALSTLSSACIDFGAAPARDATVNSLTDATPADSNAGDANTGDAFALDAETPDAAVPCVEGPVDTTTASVTLTINLIRFNVDAPEVHIASGDILAWRNTDTRAHRLVSGVPDNPILPADGGFNTGAIASGSSYAHRFCTLRTILYYCSNHPGVMNGYRIVIE